MYLVRKTIGYPFKPLESNWELALHVFTGHWRTSIIAAQQKQHYDLKGT